MRFEDLSVRAKNVCKANGMQSTSDIKKFINEGGDLYSLRNSGKKTVHELGELIQKNSENLEDELINNLKEKFNRITNDIKSKELFYIDFMSLLDKLSVRARNGYLSITDNKKDNLDVFIDKVIFNNLSFESIRNLGKKSITELNFFKKNIEVSIDSYDEHNIDENLYIIKKIENFLGFTFKEIEDNNNNFLDLVKNKEVDLIYFFDFYIINQSIEKELDKLLITRYLFPNNHEINTNDKIAKKVGLTRERVRQIITKTVLKRRFIGLNFLVPYSYNIESKLKQNYFKVELPENLKEKNLLSLEYSPSVYARTLDTILFDYSVLSEGEVLGPFGRGIKYRQELFKPNRILKVNYIFSKEFINKELCIEILNEILLRICQMIKQDYYYNPFLNFSLSVQQKNFVSELICENFNLTQSSEGFLFKRNSHISIDELVEEILKKADKPLLIEEIYQELKINYPYKFKARDVESIRSTFVRFKDKFIYLRAARGRKTLYGLREWEETKNLKAGSIKQLCIDYLETKSNPVHMLELSRFIMKNRETNQYNILSNLKLDPHDNFIYFKSKYIGLKKKKYDKKFIDSIKSFGGTKSGKVFEFIKNNIYYNYNSIIEKFSNELKAYPVQIEQSIINGIDNEILYRKGEKIYYNSIQEDYIIKDLFKSETDIKILGYNPYRIFLDNEKVVFKVVHSLSNFVNLLESYFDFDKNTFYDRGYFSKYRCLLIYNPSLMKYRVYLWNNNLDISKINLHFKFNDKDEFTVTNIDSTTNIVDFKRNNLSKFLTFLNVLLESEMRYDEFKIDGKLIDLNYLNIENLSELNAISKITNEALKKFNTELDISEAREIYQRIKLSKS